MRILLKITVAYFCFLSLVQAQKTLFFFDKVAISDGLAGGTNYFVHKDTKGFCWISSVDGLNRFDGQNVKVYSQIEGDSNSIWSNNTQSPFIEDEYSNLWFSSTEALIEYDRTKDHFNNYLYPQKPFGGTYSFGYLGYKDSNENFWLILDESKVVTFNKNRAEEFKEQFDLGASAQRMKPIFDGNNELKGFIFYSYKHPGFDYYDLIGNKRDSFLKSDSGSSFFLRNIEIEGDSIAWVATMSGVVKLNLLNGKFQLIEETKNIEVQDIEVFDDEHFIIASKKSFLSLLRKDNQKLEPFNFYKENFKSIPIKVYKDNDDNLWVSSEEDGIYYTSLNNAKFKHISDGLEHGVKVLLEDSLKNLWFVTNYNGFYKYSNELKKISYAELPFSDSEAKPSLNFWAFSDVNDQIWILNNRGIFVKNSETNKTKKINLDFSALSGLQTNDGNIYFSSLTGGVYQYTPEKIPVLTKVKTVPDKDFWVSIYQLKNNDLITCNNANSLDIYSIEDLKKKKSIPIRAWIYDYYEASDSLIWLASENGLIKLNPITEEYKTYNQQNGQPFRVVKAINKNEAGLWLSTNTGLVKFFPEENMSLSFNKKDGIVANSFYEGASLQRSNGELWFGSEEGVSFFDPDSIRQNDQPVQVQLIDVLVNDEPAKSLLCEENGATNVSEIQSLIFEKSDNTLSFKFVAMDFADPNGTQLQYKLDGYDKSWVYHPVGESGFARYANLPAGNYRFKIKGANSDGIWNEKPKEIKVIVNPHFTETSWFKILIASIIAGLFYSIYLYRMNQIKEREQLRTKAAENKMEALRSQMNPHFIFNSLNSINSYILGNEVRQASRYVGKFAKLMRMILDYSKYSTISLEKEAEMLKLYADVEKLRFKVPFEFELNIDDEVDDFDTQVPPMMLQPFVENAIWHGIANKKNGVGKISVNISEEENWLRCEVEDNGIGRDASAAIKAQKGRGHKSRALEITKERLQILHVDRKNDENIVFQDLKDKNGAACGTKAIIRIPI